MNDLHGKFEATLAHLEQEADDKDAQIESLNEAIEKLSEQVYILEDENDKFKEDHDKMKEEDDAERERLETLAAALKEVRPVNLTLDGVVNTRTFAEID